MGVAPPDPGWIDNEHHAKRTHQSLLQRPLSCISLRWSVQLCRPTATGQCPAGFVSLPVLKPGFLYVCPGRFCLIYFFLSESGENFIILIFVIHSYASEKFTAAFKCPPLQPEFHSGVQLEQLEQWGPVRTGVFREPSGG